MQNIEATKIALDESGNSGQNLLIDAVPLLALASVCLSDEQIAETESHFGRINSKEWKFSQFKKHPTQLDLFLQLAEKSWITGNTVRVHLTHKKYFAVTKLVDLIYEPLARTRGIDLYEKGAALAIANVLITTLPIYLGDDGFTTFIASFVNLVRKHDETSLVAFRKETAKAHETLEEKGFNKPFNILNSVLVGCDLPEVWLDFVSDTELDPLVPAYFTTIEFWGQKFGSSFTVVSDTSKALSQHIDMIKALSNPSLPTKKLPSVGGGWVEFPYRSTEIQETCSTSDRSVQIADLFAGASFSVFKAMANHRPLDSWQETFKNLFFRKELCLGGYWPSSEISPEELEAEHVTGDKPIDYINSILSSQ